MQVPGRRGVQHSMAARGRRGHAPCPGRAVIGTTIFLSAFLLFLVQPIVAKLILPRFGGGVAVWATCLVFFQLALLLGYLYAHAVVQHDRRGRWRTAHIALL